jgi:hypothetical protein
MAEYRIDQHGNREAIQLVVHRISALSASGIIVANEQKTVWFLCCNVLAYGYVSSVLRCSRWSGNEPTSSRRSPSVVIY